jgi:IS605 OrfB family transposase
MLGANVKRLTIGYAKYREAAQSVKGNGRVRGSPWEGGVRLKVANVIANTAEELNAVVVLERPPKRCPRNVIEGVKDSLSRRRIHQADFRGMARAIEEGCFERGVPSQRSIRGTRLRGVRFAILS